MKKFLKETSLISAGVLLQIPLIKIFDSSPNSPWWMMILIIFISAILILFGAGLIDEIILKIILLQRRLRKGKSINIGIFNEIPWEENDRYHSWTNISPNDWSLELKKYLNGSSLKLKISFINSRANYHKYDVIINPYGGTYIENDPREQKTLYELVNYIELGGVVINVSDIPGFYKYIPQIKGTILAPANDYILSNTVFIITPLLAALGGKCLGRTDEITEDYIGDYKKLSDGGNTLYVQRYIEVERNIESIITPIKAGERYMTPFGFMRYGYGKFLFSTVDLTNPANLKFRNAFVRNIAQILEIESIRNNQKD